jgi:hypothetical protein
MGNLTDAAFFLTELDDTLEPAGTQPLSVARRHRR